MDSDPLQALPNRFARPAYAGRLARWVGFIGCVVCGGPVWAQLEPASGDSTVQAADAVAADQPLSDDSAVTREDAQRVIAQLASPTFAERERATEEILRIGMPIIPLLREAAESRDDAELAARAQVALLKMTTGDFEARIADFLAGKDVGGYFRGWPMVSATLGDSPETRDLFAQLMRAHPDLIESLDGTTRERIVSVEQTSQKVQQAMREALVFPTTVDAIALLLPLADPAVALSLGYEGALISVLTKQMAALQRDTRLWPKVGVLVGEWVARSRLENRSDVLWYSMQWDIDAGGTLAVRTLGETTDIETLQMAMQAISRFGTVADAQALGPFLDDSRSAVTRMPVMVGDETLRVSVADAALAAIAILYQVPHTELGMEHVELHIKVGYLTDTAGYPASKVERRAAAIAKARRWLAGESPHQKVGS